MQQQQQKTAHRHDSSLLGTRSRDWRLQTATFFFSLFSDSPIIMTRIIIFQLVLTKLILKYFLKTRIFTMESIKNYIRDQLVAVVGKNKSEKSDSNRKIIFFLKFYWKLEFSEICIRLNGWICFEIFIKFEILLPRCFFVKSQKSLAMNKKKPITPEPGISDPPSPLQTAKFYSAKMVSIQRSLSGR